MVNMKHVVTNWSGGKIGTGYSNHYFTADIATAQQMADSVRAFFQSSYSSGAFLPGGISISVSSVVDTIDPTNGHLISSESTVPPTVITGSDVTRYAALAGGCVTWKTADFSPKGHRIRGRTFLVPCGGGALQSDGTLDTTFLGFINSAATALVAALPELLVWRRPTGKGATDGSSHPVTSGVCQDKASYLTSRR